MKISKRHIFRSDSPVSDEIASDRPISVNEYDPLNFNKRAAGLSSFLRNNKTKPPLTMAVTGEWGSGKSSFLNLVASDLRDHKCPVICLNVFQSQSEDDLFASMLQRIGEEALPPVWQPRGILFRSKLLSKRLIRRRVIFLIILLIVTFISGFLIAKPSFSPVETLNTISAQFSGLKFRFDLRKLWPWLVTSAPIFALVISLIDLLTKGRTLSGQVKYQDIKRHRDFRSKFIEDFADITSALYPLTLVIIIDDLDRCRHDTIMTVMEMVNLLYSAGKCFFIIGMSTTRVQSALAKYFQSIDHGINFDQEDFNLADEDIPKDVRSQKVKFANEYLRKFVNIEVSLPNPTSDIRHILSGSFVGDVKEVKLNPFSYRRLTRHITKAISILGIIAIFAVGFWGGQKAAVITRTKSIPILSDIFNISWFTLIWFSVPFFLSIILLLMNFINWVSERRVPFIKDSETFIPALKNWYPVLCHAHHNPLSIKSFINRLRMQMHILTIEKIALPEASIVALCVLSEAAPELLEGDIRGEKLEQRLLERNIDKLLLRDILAAFQNHEKTLGELILSEDQIEAFQAIKVGFSMT